MITLAQIAEYLEEGLNSVLNEPFIKFHIWADVGHFDEPFRSGNTITRYLTGNLRTASSSNDANLLLMGTNGLTLDFTIPTKRPRTTAKQTAEELQETEQGQYPFVQQVAAAINKFFEKPQSFVLSDGENQYSVSFQAGTSLSGVVDIQSQLGKHVTASVYIQLYFIKGGTMSNDISVTFDGSPVPFQEIVFGRSKAAERDVYAENFVSKEIASSSAFSIDLKFPSNSDVLTRETIGFLLEGEPNTAHFVSVQWGTDGAKKLYLMTANNTTATAAGVTIAGVSVALVEITESVEMLSVPNGFQIGRFAFTSSEATTLTFTLSEACEAFIAGEATEAEGVQTVPLLAGDFEYDEESDTYYVYLITDRAVTVSDSSATFTVVKEAVNG